MDKARLVQKLNHAISLELCALLQYYQNALVLKGPDRRLWEDVFKEMSQGGFEDARTFGTHVTALGGVPTVEPAPVTQATQATEMLENALDLEQRLVAAYTDALGECEDNPAYRNLLEDQILHETKDCEELEKYLDRVQTLAGATPIHRKNQTA